jgi:hypothetical protein
MRFSGPQFASGAPLGDPLCHLGCGPQATTQLLPTDMRSRERRGSNPRLSLHRSSQWVFRPRRPLRCRIDHTSSVAPVVTTEDA